jgi:hypothetical protein
LHSRSSFSQYTERLRAPFDGCNEFFSLTSKERVAVERRRFFLPSAIDFG